MANPTLWYRLVLDEQGQVDSCECVDAVGSDESLRVVYVMARTPKEAARRGQG